MKKLTYLALAAGVLLSLNSARATTVIPPTFDELVGQAEVIFQGSVTNVTAQWVGEGAERHINTYVTFKIDEAMKGNPGANYTVQMLGGTVGDETMEVSDTPKFKVGDRDILFVTNNGKQFVPFVGIMHGRFHVQKNSQTAGREIIATDDGARLANPEKLGKEAIVSAKAADAISSSDFKASIRARVGKVSAAPVR